MNVNLRTTNASRNKGWIGGLYALGALAILAVTTSLAAPNATPKVDELPTTTTSVFVDRPDFGRDPFFPKSTRRGAVAPTNSTAEPVFNATLAVKGISVNNERRLAIINNRTFEVGEEAELRINGQLTKVKCVEIRDNSVVVSVNGATKELFLGQKP